MHSSELCPTLEQVSESPLCQYDSNSLPREPNEAHIDSGNTSQIQLQATPSAQHHLMEQGSRGQEPGPCTEVSRGEAATETEQGPLPCQGPHVCALLLAGQHPEVKMLSLNPFSLTSILLQTRRALGSRSAGWDVSPAVPLPQPGNPAPARPLMEHPGRGLRRVPPT